MFGYVVGLAVCTSTFTIVTTAGNMFVIIATLMTMLL